MSSPRVVLITGATDGIGQHTALRFAQQPDAAPVRLLLHGRSEARLEATRQRILAAAPAARTVLVDTFCFDLQTIAGAKALAAAVSARCDALHVLINNAGVLQQAAEVTSDGIELTFAVNVCATFVLCCELMPLLRRTAGHKRILNVSSISMSDCGRVDFSRLDVRAFQDAFHAYGLSKLCVAMVSHELALRTDPVRDALVLCCDPGTVNTKMLLAGWGACGIEVGDADDEFALTTATFDASAHGTYWNDRRKSRPSPDVLDAASRAALWTRLEQLCGTMLPRADAMPLL